jgi:lysophospholipase L1-like esterase
MITQLIEFDVKKDSHVKITAKEGDINSRNLEFRLLDNSLPFSLVGRTVRCYMVKPDKRIVFNDLQILDAEDGRCVLTLSLQSLIVSGMAKIELIIYEDGKKLSIIPIKMDIIKSLNSDDLLESTNEFGALNDALWKIDTFAETINGLNSRMDQITDLKLLMNVNGTTYKMNDSISVAKITRLQNLYMAEFLRKLRKGVPVTIACMGDSMTYGHDTSSSNKRPADTTPCDDGSKHSFTRASITYPESLQKYLNKMYADNVTVINRGYSGDYVKKGVDRWNKKHNAYLTIIMYGTNDSRANYVPAEYRGNIEQYLKWYEQAIVREILWGKAVVIFTPPKLQSFGDLDVDTFANGLVQLCEKYNVPCIDTELFTINYNSIHSDGVHFNGVGYEIFGMKSASVFVAENLLKPQHVRGGTKLLNRQTIDSFVVKGTYSYNATSGAYTPSELNNTGGSVLNLNPGSSITYSFYCEEDDMFVIPYIYTGAEKIKIVLDHGIKAQENSLDASIAMGAKPLDNNKLVLEFTNSNRLLIDKDGVYTKGIECLRIPTKGWHTLTISNEHKQSTDGTLVINGIEFVNYDVYAKYVNINKYYRQNYLNYTSHSVLGSEDSVSEMRIKPLDYLKLYPFYYREGSEYWRNPPLQLVITDYLKGSIIYTFTIGNNAATTVFHGERERLGKYTGGRTVSKITLDDETREIVITFNAGLTNKSHLLLELV